MNLSELSPEVPKCSVPGCQSKSALYDPPIDPKTHQRWLIFCQRLQNSTSKGDNALKICSDHFTIDQFMKNSKILKKNASPSFPEPPHTTEPSKCELCQKCFISRIQLESHIKYHSKGYCQQCDLTIENEHEFFLHNKNLHKRLFQTECHDCHITFKTRKGYRQHVITKHQKFAFLCTICSEAFPDEISSDHHCRTHEHKSKKCILKRVFACESCGRYFPTKSTLYLHKIHHPCKPSLRSERFEKSSYLCERCERCFDTIRTLGDHMMHCRTYYSCRNCTLRFKTLKDANDHRMKHKDNEKERKYHCYYCNESFRLKQILIGHLRSHTGEKPFRCDLCSKGFAQSSSLYTHLKFHQNERKFKCDECGKSFVLRSDRDNHVKGHSEERSYVCEYCGKAFKTYGVYGQHRLIHTGERAYKCDECDKAFKRSYALTLHKRIHSGEKPNVCGFCDRRFRQSGDLKRHIRTIHEKIV